MMTRRLILLPLLVSYAVPLTAIASDNVKIELKKLQPSYDLSSPRPEALSTPSAPMNSGSIGQGSQSLSSDSNGPQRAVRNTASANSCAQPALQLRPADPTLQASSRAPSQTIAPAATQALQLAAAQSHLLPAAGTSSRLVPVGWAESRVPRASSEADPAGSTVRTAGTEEADDTDSKGLLLRQLYGWSSTILLSFAKPLSTKDAKCGDIVEAVLVNDFVSGNKLVAAKNSLVRGHVTECEGARTLSKAGFAEDRRFRTRGCLGLQFDEIIDSDGHRWPIKGVPCRQSNMTAIDANSARELRVDAAGRVIRSENALTGGLKTASNAARVATFVPVPGAMVVSAVATPVAMSAVGAASPSIAYNKPVDKSVKNRRLKGATYAFLTNLPGAFVVQSVVEKGNEIEINEGDTLTISAALIESGYRLPPGEALQVNGKVVTVSTGKRLYPASVSAKQPGNL